MRRLALLTLAVLASAGCSDRSERERPARAQGSSPSSELVRVDTGITHPADSSPGPATTPAEESPPAVATVTQPRPRRHTVRPAAEPEAAPAYRQPEPEPDTLRDTVRVSDTVRVPDTVRVTDTVRVSDTARAADTVPSPAADLRQRIRHEPIGRDTVPIERTAAPPPRPCPPAPAPCRPAPRFTPRSTTPSAHAATARAGRSRRRSCRPCPIPAAPWWFRPARGCGSRSPASLRRAPAAPPMVSWRSGWMRSRSATAWSR